MADFLLIVHTLFIGFMIFGLLLVVVGGLSGWAWIRNIRFRLLHLLGIGIVLAQEYMDLPCFLTIWENRLRIMAGEAPYTGAFIEVLLHRLIYYQAPSWVFTLLYSVFGLFVLLTWIFAPPVPRSRKHGD